MSRVGRSLALASLAALALVFALAGCKHDLDKLSAKHDSLRDGGASGKAGGSAGKSGSGSAGRGGSSGSSGKGGSSGSSGSAGSDAPDAGPSCEPCDPPSEVAKTLGLRSCCRGVLRDECGLTFGEGTFCLPRMVPGQDNAACEGLRMGDRMLRGCCRPDGRCGVVAEGIGLGCIAREEVAPVLGPGATAPAAVACEYSCEDDSECEGPFRGLQCAASLDQTRHYCAQTCGRDADCPRGSGTLCSLTGDSSMKRVQAICTEPVGDAEPGGTCTRTDDCAHNICGRLAGEPNFCSQLCKGPSDCRAGYKSCEESNYGSAADGGMVQKFFVCQPPAPP